MQKSITNAPTRDCILCGRCLSVCPVFLATGFEELSPRAKHHMLKTLRTKPEQLRMASCRNLADKCLSCGRCHGICPQGLSVPDVLAQLRAEHPQWQQWVWQRWIEKGAALWPLLSTFGRIWPEQSRNRNNIDTSQQKSSANEELPCSAATGHTYGQPFPVTERLKSMLASARSMSHSSIIPLSTAPRSTNQHSTGTHSTAANSMTTESVSPHSGAVPLYQITLTRCHPASNVRSETPESETQPSQKQTVMLFSGCTARRVQKQWQQKATKLLTALGYTVLDESALTCCGLTLDHAGIPDAARTARQKNLAQWRNAGRPRIVTFCATCMHGLQAYPQDDQLKWATLENDSEAIVKDEATLWAKQLTPLSTLLTNCEFTLPDNTTALPLLFYHEPCHWDGNDPDKQWLASLLGKALHLPSGPQCCGMGGVLQLADPQLSHTVAARCWNTYLTQRYSLQPEEQHKTTDIIQLITGCSGCVIQLRATAPKTSPQPVVSHWLDILQLP